MSCCLSCVTYMYTPTLPSESYFHEQILSWTFAKQRQISVRRFNLEGLCQSQTSWRHLSQITFNPDIRQTEYDRYIWSIAVAVPLIFCTPVAIYFGVKFKLTTPSICLLPAKLLCCCSEKRARSLVLSLTLWFNMVAAYFLVGHCVFVLLSFLVAPFAVAVNVLLPVLTFLCLTYIMALVFTICASVGTRRCLRSRTDCVATVHAAMLIPFTNLQVLP